MSSLSLATAGELSRGSLAALALASEGYLVTILDSGPSPRVVHVSSQDRIVDVTVEPRRAIAAAQSRVVASAAENRGALVRATDRNKNPKD